MPKEVAKRMRKEHIPPIRLSPPCDVESSPTSNTNIDHLVESLPRELRDLIYFYLVSDDLATPFTLNEERLKSPFASPVLSTELLEAVFIHRPCRVTFCDSYLLQTGQVTPALRGDNLPHRSSIRHLIVRARESGMHVDDFELLEPQWAEHNAPHRWEWDEILTLPHLESLTLEIQKTGSSSFNWFNFSPIMYRLRQRNPRVQIKLCISFDELMEREWNVMANLEAGVEDAELLEDPEPVPGDPYLPMGFADVSELIQPPTAEDHMYVEEHLPGVKDVKCRDFMHGLMAETPSDRKLLAQHYVVHEPQLLRVLMAEHYKVYTRVNGKE